MTIQESTWKTPDGVSLYTRLWLPDGAVRAAVVLIHGLGEHCARYDHVAQAFNEHGIEVSSFDLRGHGRSEGIRGHIPSFDQVNQDIDHFLTGAAATNPNLPVFLYGHSMGGELVLNYILKRSPHIAGVICTSPGLGTTVPVPAIKVTLGKVLYNIAPRITMPNGLDLENLSHDREVIRAYQADPLCTNQVSARLGLDILNTGPWVVEHADLFSVPILLMQGSADHIVSPPATREFAGGVPKQWITYREWEGLFHELHNEPQKETVIQTMINWIDQRIGA